MNVAFFALLEKIFDDIGLCREMFSSSMLGEDRYPSPSLAIGMGNNLPNSICKKSMR
ncbi:hypothetical protein [Mesorhizobium sp. B2-4-14]|uniref:hypothetical protein n=1 Tax=Mesorhizobium sp. B2-4-14 TaxID=2589935 RepID=UPI0015E2AF86|nr:hypothetical protein [Mesorhizobium sp. B2-4-14]